MGTNERKDVVILGAGPAGVRVAVALNKKFKADVRIVLVDKRDFFCYTLANPRCIVDPAFAKETLVPNENVATFAQRIRISSVKAIDSDSITLVQYDGEEITLKPGVLVISTGSSSSSAYIKDEGLGLQERLAQLQGSSDVFKAAKSALIIGGGLTGVEVAGEIAHVNPKCALTVVHSSDYLCNSKQANTQIMKQFNKTNTRVILNDRVDADNVIKSGAPEKEYTTKGGEVIRAEVVLKCVGVRPNTDFVPSASLNEKGLIQVNDMLQVPTLSSTNMEVYALGDCCSATHFRALELDDMAKTVSKNLISHITEKEPKSKFKGKFIPMMVFSVGPKAGGAAGVPCILPKGVVGRYKAKEFFRTQAFQAVGYKAPKK